MHDFDSMDKCVYYEVKDRISKSTLLGHKTLEACQCLREYKVQEFAVLHALTMVITIHHEKREAKLKEDLAHEQKMRNMLPNGKIFSRQQLEDRNTELDKLVAAYQKFLELTPCDPDITAEQFEAWHELNKLKEKINE